MRATSVPRSSSIVISRRSSFVPRVLPLSQGLLDAFLAQKHLSEPLMIREEPEISLLPA
jgi:hypothetical protein